MLVQNVFLFQKWHVCIDTGRHNVFESGKFIEMGTLSGVQSEPIEHFDKKIFGDPKEKHVHDGVWTKINSVDWSKHY